MDPLKQSHVALRGDVNSTKSQIYQLVEAMIALAKREDNIQRTAVTKNVIPIKNSNVQECHTIQDGYSSSHYAIEYHNFEFSTPNSQGISLMVNTEHPQDDEIIER